jgi:hypothetical protein
MAKQMEKQTKTSPGLIAAAWIVVCVPLAWGVYNTGLEAAKLFTATQPTAAPATAAPAATTPR